MSRNQVIYNQIGVFAGGASPGASGYQFISSDGVINNDSLIETGNYPLIFPLKRVTSCSYSFEANRTNIFNLGDFGTIARPILNNTEINFSVNYMIMGLVNELRLGFLCNTHYDSSPEEYLLYGTGRAPLLSGLYSRDYSPSSDSSFNYPLKSREPRNIFVSCKKDSLDFNDTDLSTTYRNTDIDVYGFGNCYMTSYRSSAGVGQIPEVSVGFVCHNVEVYSSGFNNGIPSVNPQTYNTYQNVKFSIPNNFEGDDHPTVMIPSDITLSIRQKSNGSEDLDNLFLDFNDIKIQSYEFDINLPRTPLYRIGQKYPLDRVLSGPILSNLNFSILPGDNKASSLVSLIEADENYDVFIRLNYQRDSLFEGCGVCYEFINAKFNGFNSNTSIQQKNNINLSFTTELDPTKVNRGLFMTGYLGFISQPLEMTTLSDDFDGGGIDELLFQDDDIFTLILSGRKLLY